VQQRSSPKSELLYLLAFLALFTVTLSSLNAWLLPHGYNRIVVVILASIIAGIVYVFGRAAIARRA